MGVPFPAGLPIRDFHVEILSENLGEALEKPPESRFVRPDHPVGDFFQDPVRFPPRKPQQVAVGGRDLVGLARLDGNVPEFADGGFDAVAPVYGGENGGGISRPLHGAEQFPVIGDRFLRYRDGRERFAGNPVGRGEESPLPGSFRPEERRVEDEDGAVESGKFRV
ncbi:MAG: hypothetical protein Q8J97_10465 [Flavobacteriaceae bacterium]|nr:hypothetical protein [Flavobacteriaceae bacterium]